MREPSGLMVTCALLLTSCFPVSCDRKPPQTDFAAGPFEVAVRRIDRCTFELADGFARGPFPRSRDGFYAIVANEYSQSWDEISYDAGVPAFTVHGRECERGITQLDVTYYRWMRTVTE